MSEYEFEYCPHVPGVKQEPVAYNDKGEPVAWLCPVCMHIRHSRAHYLSLRGKF